MISSIILGCVAIGIALAGGTATALMGKANRKIKAATRAKLASQEKAEKEIELLKEAMRKLAQNNGQGDATYIKALSMYEIDEATVAHVIKVHNANKGAMTDKEKAKLDKAVSKQVKSL